MQAVETKYHIGFTACYIRDHKFEHFLEIPQEVAVAWVKAKCPNIEMGHTHVLAKDLTVDSNYDSDAKGNGWLNKLFIVVGNDHGKWVALSNHDGRFSIYVETA